MPERKLATVEVIKDLQPIEGADRLELATVRGWDVVVRKDEFKVGQKVVYFEIDSFLDVEKPMFAFLESRGVKVMNDPEDENKKIYGHALRTIKLRGQISQGLILPLEEVSSVLNHLIFPGGSIPEGVDLTGALDVLKYEPYVKPQSGPRKLSTFPTEYAVKSDAERVQNLSDRQWEALKAIPGWYATQKIDGSSMTVWKDEEGELHVASRNFEIVDADESNVFYKYLKDNEEFFDELLWAGEAVQGELYGEGIQKNPQRHLGVSFAPFNFFTRGLLESRLSWEHLDISTAPPVPVLDLPFPETVKEAVAQAYDLRQVGNPDLQAEGIVWHNSDPEVAKILGRNCWKSINNLYLAKLKD